MIVCLCCFRAPWVVPDPPKEDAGRRTAGGLVDNALLSYDGQLGPNATRQSLQKKVTNQIALFMDFENVADQIRLVPVGSEANAQIATEIEGMLRSKNGH